ncbi:MAG TPA: sulfide-dependent adenosine diphosphate thiazole synthase [Planctomycetota bacterium]|nr:sulfide-dependent adenosine diphosphate thiazole synthase [Planctomycetota bacterium]
MALFASVREKDVTRAIVDSFLRQFSDYADCDCIIVGGGPSGLWCGKDLAAAGYKVLIIERNNYVGGGFWIGGYFMNKVTIRKPAHECLEELGVPYEEPYEGLCVCDGPHVCSALIAAACKAGVKFASLTCVDDIVLRGDGRVAGVVINWTPIRTIPKEIAALDPVAMESKIVVDSTGHDASVIGCLERRGLIKTRGMGAMWINESEDAVVEKTGLVYPGLVASGMAVSTLYGLPRMGPTFGSMLISGKRAAQAVIKEIG